MADFERQLTIDIKKITKVIPAYQREGGFQALGDLLFDHEYVNVHIPIIPHTQVEVVKNFEPSRLDSGFRGEHVKWNQGAIIFDVPVRGYGYNKDDAAVKAEVEQSIQWMYNKLQFIESDLDNFNKELKQQIARRLPIVNRR